MDLIFYVLLLCVGFPSPTSFGFEVRDVCTGTNTGMTIVQDTPERKIQALKNRYENCQYVDGNLEITGLDTEEFYNTDLSFLNSIREVTGYVLIANVYAQNVTLENLTIIRGDTLFRTHKASTTAANNLKSNGYALFVSLNSRKGSNSIGMKLLGLRNLVEISSGDVSFEDNNLLCYATTNIYWNGIFLNGNNQRITFGSNMQNTNHCKPRCHSTCEVEVPPNKNDLAQTTNVTRRFCWGPGPKNCQKMNKVTCAEQCEGGRCSGRGPNQCCHPQCAGGCNGPTKSDCWECRNFYHDGGCEPYCPQQLIYDNTNFKWVENPDKKFAFGKLCVRKCPANWLEHKGGCIKSCPQGHEPNGTKCIQCMGPCPIRCQIKWDATKDFLNSKNIGELEGCTHVDGHLKILDASIRGDPYNNIEPMDVSELQKLKSIQEITEFLMIQNLNGFGITNFSFLSNLEAIQGRKLDTYGTALNIISNRDLEFLGFTSLKRISAGHVIIESNPKLCYLDDLNWSRLSEKTTRQFLRRNADNRRCVSRGKKCHDECSNGCWGPGAHKCMNCQHYRYNDECLNNCNRPMLFSKPGNKMCFDCNAECNSTCTGPSAKQCDACRNFNDGSFCVPSCPNDNVKRLHKYPDAKATCQLCHANCINGCTGPENAVGENGCNIKPLS